MPQADASTPSGESSAERTYLPVVCTENSPFRLTEEQWANVIRESNTQQQYRRDWADADEREARNPQLPEMAVRRV